jgi:hypothetical protein
MSEPRQKPSLRGAADVYHPRWMSKLGIHPVPAWTVVWLFDLQNWCRGRR